MSDDSDAEVGRLAANLRRGSIVAAAGCGKTEQIARAVGFSDRRRLILTHTHAGVDALTKRLKRHQIPSGKYRVDTIAGWCLRFAASFPNRSGIEVVAPKSTEQWDAIYGATARLIDSGAVGGVLTSSYGGCFVDEYQDCTRLQHEVILRLTNQLPTCIFGDPLQAIFDFGGQHPVNWENDVFPAFGKEAELTTPWRWKIAGNPKLAEWLTTVRSLMESGGAIDLADRPACVSWIRLPADPNAQQATIVAQCLDSMREVNIGDLIVIGDSANVNRRSALAQKLARQGFSNIEPVGCKDLFAAANAIERSVGLTQFNALLNFAGKCMTGTDKAELERAVVARQEGRRLGQAKFGALFPLTDAVIQSGGDAAILAFLQALQERTDTYLFRRELFFAMRSALQIKATHQLMSLSDAIWQVQNRIRHAGRRLSARNIGSTLLVKGLEFDRAIVVHAETMTRRDWYVALTRASRRVRVISPLVSFNPGT